MFFIVIFITIPDSATLREHLFKVDRLSIPSHEAMRLLEATVALSSRGLAQGWTRCEAAWARSWNKTIGRNRH